MAKLASQVLDEMVNEELIVQAAEAAKIEVDSSEVQAALDEIKQQNNLDDAGGFHSTFTWRPVNRAWWMDMDNVTPDGKIQPFARTTLTAAK